MKLQRLLALPALLACMTLPVAAQDPGTKLPDVKLTGLSQTEAKSYDDFAGRTVLIEFFAYW